MLVFMSWGTEHFKRGEGAKVVIDLIICIPPVNLSTWEWSLQKDAKYYHFHCLSSSCLLLRIVWKED